MKTYKELRNIHNPDGSPLRKAQMRMVDMLIFIDEVCKEHGLKYWLDSGTLLGAARHHAFIPWDDDTDICMPRKDFLRFKRIMIEHYSHHQYVLQCPETDTYFLSPWIVLRDTKSEYIQKSNLHKIRKYRGLQVDIFPLETKHTRLFHRLCSSYQGRLVTSLLFKHSHSLHMMAYLFFHLFDKIIEPILRRLSPKHSYYRMAYGITFTSVRYLNTIYPLSTISFEGHTFASPKDPDTYLRNIYGDWKIIPSEKEIQTHEVKCIFYN